MPRTARILPALIVLALIPESLLNAQQNEIRSLASSLAEDLARSGKKAIAVVDFTDLQGNASELGRFLAEEFSVAMTRTRKGFEVIDRTHLKTILAEHKLSASGLIDPSTAKKLGQIVGADVLLTGSITPFSESVRISVKAIATDTARILAADTADLPKTKTIAELGSGSLSPAPSRSGAPAQVSNADADGKRPRSDADERPYLRRADDSTPSSVPPARATIQYPAPAPRVITAASEEFVFELIGCRGIGTSVRCSLRITNRGRDRDLNLNCSESERAGDSYYSRAFDNMGNESVGGDCRAANRNDYDAHLISGVGVPFTIVFKNLAPTAASLSGLFINAVHRVPGTLIDGPVQIVFRNVPVSR